MHQLQETLSWQGSSLPPEPPIIRIQSVPTRPASSLSKSRSHTPDITKRRNLPPPSLGKRSKSDHGKYESNVIIINFCFNIY